MFCKIEVKLYPFYLPLFLPSIPGINRFVRILIMFCAKKSLFFSYCHAMISPVILELA